MQLVVCSDIMKSLQNSLISFEQVNLLRGGDLFPFSRLQASGHPTIVLAVLSARKSFSPRPWNPPQTDIRYTRKKIWPESGSTTKWVISISQPWNLHLTIAGYKHWMYKSTLYRALDHQKHKLVNLYSEKVLSYRISYVSDKNLLPNLYICLLWGW